MNRFPSPSADTEAMFPFNPAGSVHAYFEQSAGSHVSPCWNCRGDNSFGSMAVLGIACTVKSGPNDGFSDKIFPMSTAGDGDVLDAPVAPFAEQPPSSARPTMPAKASSILGNRTRAIYRIKRLQPRNVATA